MGNGFGKMLRRIWGTIREFSRSPTHVPFVEVNPHRGEKVEMNPEKMEGYKERTSVERMFSRLK